MKPLMKLLAGITIGILLGASVDAAVGTFTFRTNGASDTVEAVDLVYPQRVPEADSVTTESIADGSVTNAKLAEPVSVANGGTGKTTAAAGLAALGGASLNGSSTVDFTVSTLTAVTKALLGGATDDGVHELQVIGEAKFSLNTAGAFKQTYASTGGDVATTTVVVGDIAGNGDMVTIYLDIVGSRAGPGYEKFHVMIGAYNNAGTIVFVDDAPTVTSDISLGLGMTDPLITCEAVGNTITIKVTVLDAYSRLAINTTAAGYVTGVK